MWSHGTCDTPVLLEPGDWVQMGGGPRLLVLQAKLFPSQKGPFPGSPPGSPPFEHGRWTVPPHILGTGSFGQVRLAWDRQDHRQVAVKIMRASRASDMHEVKMLMRVRGHEGIANVLGFGHLGPYSYMFLELATGSDLFNWVHDHPGRPTEGQVACIGRQILEAVKYLHSKSVAHCDIKPENVLIDSRFALKPKIRLTDFGHAWYDDGTLATRARYEDCSAVGGTPGYLPPEYYSAFLRKSRFDPFPADVWAVGITLLFVLLRHGPFDGDKLKQELSPYARPYIHSVGAIEKPDVHRRASMATPPGSPTEISLIEYEFLRLFRGWRWEEAHEDLMLSMEAKRFLSELVQPDIVLRYTASEALRQPWLKQADKSQSG